MKYVRIAIMVLIISFSVLVSVYAYTASCDQLRSGFHDNAISEQALNSVANLKINLQH